MEKIKTATGKEFECIYFNPFPPMGQVNISIINASFSELAAVFSDPTETVQLWYDKQYLAYHTRLIAVVNDGDSIRVVLGKE
jgi:hypothetical protein